MNPLVLLVISMLATYLLLKLVLVLFPRWGLMDRPEAYGLNRKPIPYSAGIVVFIVFALCVLFLFPMHAQFLGLILGGTLIALVSFYDDFFRLPPLVRLFAQAVGAGIAVLSGLGISTITGPLGGTIELAQWIIPYTFFGHTGHIAPFADLFTIAWIVFLMNAINFMDGVPGMVSGTGAIAAFTIAGLSALLIASPTTTLEEKQAATAVLQLSLILGGSLFVFNRFDLTPPRLLIGDSGTMSVGYLLAVLAIFSGGKVATTMLVLGLPVADSLWVIGRRIIKGQSPFQGDFNHYHHKLLRLGWSERSIVYAAYGISLLLGILSLIFLFYFKTFAKTIVLSLFILFLFISSMLLIKKETKDVKKI